MSSINIWKVIGELDFSNLTVALNTLWQDLEIKETGANESYSSLSDAFGQIVHLNKSIIEHSYPALRAGLDSYLKK